MSCYVFCTSIAGAQLFKADTSTIAYGHVHHLMTHLGHSHAYLYDAEDRTWFQYTKGGVRGRLTECEWPEDEVPKVYRLLLMLEN